jgi:hypothetical protein
MNFVKTEKTIAPSGREETWGLTEDGPPHKSKKKVNGKFVDVIHWQPMKWWLIKVEDNNG